MPKIERLTKDKMIAIIQTDLWDEGGKLPRGYFKKDVKMAVEWLEGEQASNMNQLVMHPIFDRLSDEEKYRFVELLDSIRGKIKIAFEDVTKQNTKG